jgi:cbb3-type cytochrome oxidase maturation protein
MNALLILVPLSLLWLAAALAAFVWAVRSGQFEALDSAAFNALTEPVDNDSSAEGSDHAD